MRAAARARPEAARHHDARGVRERDGGGDGARRLDQRGAAPDRDGARRRRAARRSTTSSASSDRVPLLADFKPSGKYVMEDLHAVGGTPAVMKYLLEHGLLDGSCMTVTGKTHRREPRRPARPDGRAGRDPPARGPDQDDAATSRSCAATSRPTARSRRSPARKASASPARRACSTAKRTCCAALEQEKIDEGRRDRDPLRGPEGRPRHARDADADVSAIMGAGLGKDVALLTDGRFCGGSHGFIVGHVTPEAQEGGPIALVARRRPDHDRRARRTASTCT